VLIHAPLFDQLLGFSAVHALIKSMVKHYFQHNHRQIQIISIFSSSSSSSVMDKGDNVCVFLRIFACVYTHLGSVCLLKNIFFLENEFQKNKFRENIFQYLVV